MLDFFPIEISFNIKAKWSYFFKINWEKSVKRFGNQTFYLTQLLNCEVQNRYWNVYPALGIKRCYRREQIIPDRYYCTYGSSIFMYQDKSKITWHDVTLLFLLFLVIELIWHFWNIWVTCRGSYSCWTIFFTQRKKIQIP